MSKHSTIYSQAFGYLDGDKKTLWIADENVSEADLALLSQNRNCTLITNRFDLLNIVKTQHPEHRVIFNDFDFSQFKENEFEQILYRVSKEKLTTHWVINNCAHLIELDGKLLLAGGKEEGIKTYSDKTTKLLHFSGKLNKSGKHYFGLLLKTSKTCANNTEAPHPKLDHNNYPQLRPAIDAFGASLLTKPGLYGWNKIDEGSRLLAECFASEYGAQKSAKDNSQSSALTATVTNTSTNTDTDTNTDANTAAASSTTALDLGCSYGYLCAALASAGIQHIVATDNNAAAEQAAAVNLASLAIESWQFIADNCASSIESDFDWILCNPPFHQGYAIESSLTERFVQAAHRLLKPSGTALFVVNAFIPIEKIAGSLFKKQRTLANNKRFKVMAFHKL